MNNFYVKTLGCKVNQSDSEKIADEFRLRGWVESRSKADTKICVVNTCSVTEQADRKSRNAIRSVIRSFPKAKIYVTGCYARYERKLIEQLKGVSGVFEANESNYFFQNIQSVDNLALAQNSSFRNRVRGFLKIQDGCNNRCSYCVVPILRGSSRSLDKGVILSEVNKFIEAGHHEIVITGVCLGSFGHDLNPKTRLIDLLLDFEKIDGLCRFRLSSIEPADISDELIEVMARSNKICPHLHIPFQSGDDGVLSVMGRKLSVQDYIGIVKKARKSIKNLSITCDIIVGFPTETKAAFNNTVNFLKFIEPLRTHVFIFSSRRGTAIFGTKSVVSCEEARNRQILLSGIAQKISQKQTEACMGMDLRVIFESRKNGLWHGYADNYIKVGVRSDSNLRNCMKIVKIKSFDCGLALGDLC